MVGRATLGDNDIRQGTLSSGKLEVMIGSAWEIHGFNL